VLRTEDVRQVLRRGECGTLTAREPRRRRKMWHIDSQGAYEEEEECGTLTAREPMEERRNVAH